MASSKTGISLLSMYNDEEDDDMEEALNEQQQEQRGEDEEMEEDEVRKEAFADSGATTQVTEETVTVETSKFVSVTSGEVRLDSSSSLTVERRSRTVIVDYGHDEVAMSPEAEDAERPSMDVDLSTANGDIQEKALGDQPNLQLSEKFDTTQNVTMSIARELEITEGEDVLDINDTGQKDVDALDGFLPSPPQERCSDKLQDKINKFLNLKKSGKSYNAEVRNKKDYRNPDFLLHAVTYQNIDQIGSCFSKDVFDPHGYDKTDFYDEIEADYKLLLERKELERKKTPKVEFSSAGMQPGTGFTAPRVGAPSPVFRVAAPPTADIGREGRNKKSKWDKVDGDRSSSLPVGQDSILNYGGHSTVLSSAAGSGYTAFAQQKRREAEEKRSGDRRRS